MSSKLGWMFIINGMLFGILSYFSAFCGAKSTGKTKIRVITWNVADNKKMGGSFTDEAIDKVLGLDQKDASRPSIYAIGLEENCWKCNAKNMPQIGDRFVARINAVAKDHYKVIGINGTRISSTCEYGCLINSHGTTIMLVIAKDSMIEDHSEFTHNAGCHGSWVKNAEKGIAAMRIVLKKGQKTVCFGAGHLDSSKPKYRRQCLKKFFQSAKKQLWKDCSAQFIFGDFNMRTSSNKDVESKKDGEAKKGVYVSNQTYFDSLKDQDELAGSTPFNDNQWKGTFLSYINSIHEKKFKEGPFGFLPTYSILSAEKYCDGRFPCYRDDRPKSWTDRIIYNNDNGKCLSYDAVYAEYGDHFPVFGEYLLGF